MRFHRVTSVVGSTPSFISPLMNWLEGIVTEIDFNSVPVGTAIDTHYADVTFELVDKSGAIESVVTAVDLYDPDPNDPKGSASLVIGPFNDLEKGIVRATSSIHNYMWRLMLNPKWSQQNSLSQIPAQYHF